jgi:tetratricopeptide (TPR) repeat protein
MKKSSAKPEKTSLKNSSKVTFPLESQNLYSRLYTPQAGRSLEVGDLHKTLYAGKKMTLADISGPGVIGNIFMTHYNRDNKTHVLASRGVIIRCFWDGGNSPSVEVPLNDFFGIGFGKEGRMDTAAWQRDGGGHIRIFFPMPFKKRAVIELENLTDSDLYGFYWCIEYDAGISLPDELEYFHAQYRQSTPVPKNSVHTVLETEGHGKYVGTIWSVNWLSPGCPPENAFSFFVDGVPLQGPNSEDYFGQSWGFRKDLNTLYTGQSLQMEKTDIGSTWMSSYRIHFPNPALFQKSLRFTIDCQQYNAGYRTDSYDTVAFWYQSHPGLPFPKLPRLEELLPITCEQSCWHRLWKIHMAEEAERLEDALSISEELLRDIPGNSKIPDIMFKMASLRERLGELPMALNLYRRIIKEHPKSEAAKDAQDRLWLQEKTGRLLITLVTPSGWTAYLDGQKIELSPELFKEIPAWGERIHYRYGRAQRLSLGGIELSDVQSELPDGAPIPIGTDPHASSVYDKEDNFVQWNDSSSSAMRLFTIRLEPGSGKHLFAVEAMVSNKIPIRLESQSPGGMIGVVECKNKNYVTDGSWHTCENPVNGWQTPEVSDDDWECASVYPNEEYGDASWFWLHPAGFRKFSGFLTRIWSKERRGKNCSVYFRKIIVVP